MKCQHLVSNFCQSLRIFLTFRKKACRCCFLCFGFSKQLINLSSSRLQLSKMEDIQNAGRHISDNLLKKDSKLLVQRVDSTENVHGKKFDCVKRTLTSKIAALNSKLKSKVWRFCTLGKTTLTGCVILNYNNDL